MLKSDKSFESILDMVSYFHHEIDEFILLHQEALLLQNIDLAKEVYALFRSVIESHIHTENDLLFPLFERYCSNSDSADKKARWPIMLYQKEHDKLVDMLDKSQAMLDKLIDYPEGRARRRATLSVLEYQKALKNVVEHHEEREEMALLPELDAAMPRQEAQVFINECLNVWRDHYNEQAKQLTHFSKKLES